MKNKFDICDIVKVVTTRQELAYINNAEGCIFKITSETNASEQTYSVSIFMDDELCWDVLESEMISTGRKKDPKEVFSNKFNSFDVIKIVTTRKDLAEINNCEGYILGMSRNKSTGEWGYTISIPKDSGLCWDILEDEMIATGRKIDRKSIYPGVSVRVSVDPKTGEGKLIDPDEE